MFFWATCDIFKVHNPAFHELAWPSPANPASCPCLVSRPVKSNFFIGFHPFQLVPSGSTSPQFASQGVEPSLVMRLCVIFHKELGRLRGHARGNPEDAGRPSAHAPPWSRTRKDVAVLQAEKGCKQTQGVCRFVWRDAPKVVSLLDRFQTTQHRTPRKRHPCVVGMVTNLLGVCDNQ